jgi:AraC-like DNA-binding protein
MTYRAFRTALLCAVVLSGCARDADEKEEKKARELTTAEVLDQAARASYQPPADGRLTEKQVRMYLEVKRRAREIRAAGPDTREPAVTAELRAALEVGYNPKELSWVQEQVQEAWIALRGQELDRKIAESRTRMLRDLEAQLGGATDPRQREELEKQIAEIRAAAPLATEAAPSISHNATLVRRYESEVARAFSEERGPQETRHAG